MCGRNTNRFVYDKPPRDWKRIARTFAPIIAILLALVLFILTLRSEIRAEERQAILTPATKQNKEALEQLANQLYLAANCRANAMVKCGRCHE